MCEALERLREKQGEKDASDASVEPKNNRFAGNLDRDEADEWDSNPRPPAWQEECVDSAVVTSHFA
jgi:hypothetical protein